MAITSIDESMLYKTAIETLNSNISLNVRLATVLLVNVYHSL